MGQDKVSKFHGKPSEDFHLWCARIKAVLEGKPVLRVIRSDLLVGGGLLEQGRGDVTAACEVIIQGFGDRPLRLCLSAKKKHLLCGGDSRIAMNFRIHQQKYNCKRIWLE